MTRKPLLFALAIALAAPVVHAQTVINQAAALAGGVTPGDAPGFPVTISVPGSYKLTGNLTSPAGQPNSLIHVTAADATIDLNGYTVQGVNTCTVNNPGRGNSCTAGAAPPLVYFNAPRGVLRNGNVVGSEGAGVQMSVGLSVANPGAVIEDLLVANNRGTGVSMVVVGSTLRNVTSAANAGAGFIVSGDSTLEDLVALYNNDDGVRTASRVVAHDIVAANNTGNGANVFGGTVMRLGALGNGLAGFAGEAAVSFSRSAFNVGDGFNGAVMLTQSDAQGNGGNGYTAPAAGGCYGNLYTTANAGANISAAVGFVGTLTLCP